MKKSALGALAAAFLACAPSGEYVVGSGCEYVQQAGYDNNDRSLDAFVKEYGITVRDVTPGEVVGLASVALYAEQGYAWHSGDGGSVLYRSREGRFVVQGQATSVREKVRACDMDGDGVITREEVERVRRSLEYACW